MNKQAQIAALRAHEIYCYQICYCLLHDPKLSEEAASAALLEIARDSGFHQDQQRVQQSKVRKVAVRSSLRVREGASAPVQAVFV